jgi:Flp pilus assembly protein TadG
MRRSAAAPRGQVLVIVALGITVLLALAGVAIDVGRLMAERRHLQTAADAGALAACQSLISGNVADIDQAELRAREVASVNIEGSPAGATGTMAATPEYADEDGSGFLDPDELVSGVVVSSTSARVAISSSIETTLARVVGINTLGVGARAQCTLVQEPALPIVARRYAAPEGPGFADMLATEATSTNGGIDEANPLGYDGRTPAGDGLTERGPLFEIYGVESKAFNSSEFRGFINLDIRDFRDEAERDYYNGEQPGTNENTMKAEQADYLLTGYPGPAFPAVTDPVTGDLQVATLSGHSTGHLLDAFDDVYDPGDRILLAVYDGTVKAIPDFSITPPSEIVLPATTASAAGPTFTVARNTAFTGTVSLDLRGDADAPTASDNLIPVPGTAAPTAGHMNEPTFTPDNFAPATNGTNVTTGGFQTNAIAPGIYTVWIHGTSSAPVKARRHPVTVRIGGASKDFGLENSVLSGSTDTLGGTISFEVRVRNKSWGSGSNVNLSWDSASLTDCLLNPIAAPPSMIVGFSATSVSPGGGQGTLSTMTVDTDGLPSGCYKFNVRAKGTNGDSQPVTHLAVATFYVTAQPSSGSYVDIIGFAMFEVASVDANTISGRAISPICADPQCAELRQVQRARLIPWS